jgi:hypothetical protein
VSDILALVSRARDAAQNFPKRRSDAELYRLLADCMAICERCEKEGQLERLKQEAVQRAKDRGARRAYFEAGADVYLVVGRLVFEGEKARAACWRYTSCMREAGHKGIVSGQLVGWLATNGGINALFRSRKVKARSRLTRTLHLTSAVEMPKIGPITLTLQDNGSGFYDVLPVIEEAAA